MSFRVKPENFHKSPTNNQKKLFRWIKRQLRTPRTRREMDQMIQGLLKLISDESNTRWRAKIRAEKALALAKMSASSLAAPRKEHPKIMDVDIFPVTVEKLPVEGMPPTIPTGTPVPNSRRKLRST